MKIKRSQASPPALLLVALVILAGGCSSGNESRGGPGRGQQGMPVTPVATAEVAPRDLARTVTVTGPVEPIRAVSVNAQTAGTVLRVLVEEGDRVRNGQLMAELDGRETEAQLERARATLDNAQAAFDRADQLRANELYSAAELDVLQSSLAIAKADVQLWRTRLAFCRITAPVSGMVTAKRVEQGSTVSTNQAMFSIADDSLLVVRVQVSELDVVHLQAGRAVSIRLDAYPQVELEGHIRRIFPSADASSRLVPVEVVLGDRPAGVQARPGYLARVDFVLDSRHDVLAVPAAAIGVSDGGSFVYVVAADTLSRRPVQTGMTAGGWIEVTGGLRPGEQVVSSGHMNLRPGAKVRISREGTAGGAGAGSTASGGGVPADATSGTATSGSTTP